MKDGDVIAQLDARPRSLSTLALACPTPAALGRNLQKAAGDGKRPKGHFQRLELSWVLQLALLAWVLQLVHRQEVEERPWSKERVKREMCV